MGQVRMLIEEGQSLKEWGDFLYASGCSEGVGEALLWPPLATEMTAG